MRGMVPNLPSAVPVVHQLPGAYQDGDFTARFVSVIDATLAPVFATVDNLAAHVNPDTAPEDLLAFVAMWVGGDVNPRTELADQRRWVRDALDLHRSRGTIEGLRRSVARVTGGPVEVTESGASRWSRTVGSEVPGSPDARVTVVVHSTAPDDLDLDAVRAVLAEAVPAHVKWEVEVVS
ncbi:MAG: phage tail protein [Dermatophilaceae bacterium]